MTDLPETLRHRIHPYDMSLELVDYHEQDTRLALTGDIEFGNEVSWRWNIHDRLVAAVVDLMQQVDDQQAMTDASHYSKHGDLLQEIEERKKPAKD